MSYYFSHAQKLNIFEDVDTARTKPLVIYSIAAWCGGSIEDFNMIKDTLIKYRDRFTLVLLLDSLNNNRYSFQKTINLFKPDKYYILNHYFPKRLKTKFERNIYTAYLNQFFGINYKFLGAGAFIISKNKSTSVLPLFQRPKLISEWLEFQ